MAQKTYKPSDRENGYPKGVSKWKQRIYEMLPGLFMWTLLLLPIIFGLLKWEVAMLIYVSILVAYWCYRLIIFMVGGTIAVKRMDKTLAVDWVDKIKHLDKEKVDRYNKLKYVYLCPVYSESMETLDPSFEAWANSDVGADKIDVVMAIEDKKKDIQVENFNKLKEKYGKRFGSMKYYIHPNDIPGEVAGVKGGNINWAARHTVEDIEKAGKDPKDYLLITCDSDQRPHKKYLSAVTYKYLTINNPDETFYASAIHTFGNNIWNVPLFIRVQTNMLTMATMHMWVISQYIRVPFSKERVYVRDTFSSYIVNLGTLKKYKFWDPEIPNDDTAFYWNTMIRSKGKFKSCAVFVPTYNDAVENSTVLKSYQSFYKQQYRWGWGIINFPISIAALANNKDEDFPLIKKLLMTGMMVEYLWILTMVFVLTFGLYMIGLVDEDYKYSAYSYNLPKLLTIIFTILPFISNIFIFVIKRKIMETPKTWKWYRYLLDFFESFLMIFNMLTFYFLPYLQAVTEMLFGFSTFKKNFYVTDKVKIKGKE